MASAVNPLTGSLDPDQLDRGVVHERHEHTDRVGPTADAGDHALRQAAGLLKDLSARLIADHALQLTHDQRIRSRAHA